jgi:starvation-inducible DNA-binding protein
MLDSKHVMRVGKVLQESLVSLIDLQLVGKQAHWAIRGSQFRALHLQLDEMVAEFRDFADEVAERMTAIGVVPDGRATTIAKDSGVKGLSADWVKDQEGVHYFASTLDSVTSAFRKGIVELCELDPISEDLMIGVVAGLEKQAWMIRSQKA